MRQANTVSPTGGMVISGLGAGLNELIALAGTSEMVPVRKRAGYVGAIVFTILPFCPSPLWAQLITRDAGWRFNGALVGGWNFVGLILVLFFYKDPARTHRPAKEVLSEVDWVGGFFSTAGVTLFMMGLQWGAREVRNLSKTTFLCVELKADMPRSTSGPAHTFSFHSCLESPSLSPSSSGRPNSPNSPWCHLRSSPRTSAP